MDWQRDNREISNEKQGLSDGHTFYQAKGIAMMVTKYVIILAIGIMLATGATLCAQKVGTAENEYDWQLSAGND